MAYDLEKYREKREKVLGQRKRGISFGILATIVAAVIITGTGVFVIPQSIAYLTSRNLEDAIFKIEGGQAPAQSLLDELLKLEGVKEAVADTGGSRLVVTYDRNHSGPTVLTHFFKRKDLAAVLLNTTDHNQRISTEKEEKELEAS